LSAVDGSWHYAYAGRQNMQLDEKAACREKILDLAAASDVAVPSYFCPCPLSLI